MRLLSLVPALLCTASLILTFLCLFAGSKKGFMADYAVVTLNTSQIGQNLLNDTKSSSNPFISFLDNITNSIESDIDSDLSSLAKDLGLHDFYNAHILDFCEGYYTPASKPNATVKKSSIHLNVTSCSNTTALYSFDPVATLQEELNKIGIDLSNLDWPSDITKGLKALKIAQETVFVLFCIAIGFMLVALVFALVGIFLEGRLSAFINVLVDWLAFLAIGLASAIATAVAVKAADLINKYGNDIGISATKGSKFMVLEWVATALMLVSSILWCGECIVGRRRQRGVPRTKYNDEPKY